MILRQFYVTENTNGPSFPLSAPPWPYKIVNTAHSSGTKAENYTRPQN